MEFSIKLFV